MPIIRLALIMGAVLLPACSFSSQDEAGGIKRYHFGYTQTYEPNTKNKIEAVEVKSLGLTIGDSLILGWYDHFFIHVPIINTNNSQEYSSEVPCSVVIIVRTAAEAEHVRQILAPLKGDDLCMVEFPQN